MQKTILLFLSIIILSPKPIFAMLSPNESSSQLNAITGQKLQIKINEVFANTPALLATYNKIQTTKLSDISSSPEYQALISSNELKVLNHLPETQEALKETINDTQTRIRNINQDIKVINEQVGKLKKELTEQNQDTKDEISAQEIRRKIYAQDAVVNELQRGIDSAIQDFNQQCRLYFTDPKLVNNISELTPIQKPDTLTTDTLLTSMINLDQIIDSRITASAIGPEGLGVSSGDGGTEYVQGGVWIKGLKTYAKQNKYQLTPGYKLERQGVVIGLDFIDNLIGISYAYIQDHVNSNILGTKERINSHIGTMYGFYKLSNNLLIDMQARYGKSYINKSRNNLNLSNDVSYGKTKGDIYGGKLEFVYDYGCTQRNIHIAPSIGVSYDQLQIEQYQEKGPGLNRKVGSRTVSKATGLVGARISKVMEVESFIIIPEIYVKSLHTINSKNDATIITVLEGMEPLVTKSNKLDKAIYKIGGLLKVNKSKPIDIEIGYDFSKSKKYYSHTGYISAMVFF